MPRKIIVIKFSPLLKNDIPAGVVLLIKVPFGTNVNRT